MHPSIEFLEGLGRRGHVPAFEKVDGTLRLDLREGRKIDSWMIVIHQGDVEVSRGRQDGDSVLKTDRAVFDRIVSGEVNALAAVLRGLVWIEGSVPLALSLTRILPGPPQSRWRGKPRSPSGLSGSDRARAHVAHGEHGRRRRAPAGKDRRR